MTAKLFRCCAVVETVNVMTRMVASASWLNMASPPAKRLSFDRHLDTLRADTLRPEDLPSGLAIAPAALNLEIRESGLKAARPALVEASFWPLTAFTA